MASLQPLYIDNRNRCSEVNSGKPYSKYYNYARGRFRVPCGIVQGQDEQLAMDRFQIIAIPKLSTDSNLSLPNHLPQNQTSSTPENYTRECLRSLSAVLRRNQLLLRASVSVHQLNRTRTLNLPPVLERACSEITTRAHWDKVMLEEVSLEPSRPLLPLLGVCSEEVNRPGNHRPHCLAHLPSRVNSNSPLDSSGAR